MYTEGSTYSEGRHPYFNAALKAGVCSTGSKSVRIVENCRNGRATHIAEVYPLECINWLACKVKVCQQVNTSRATEPCAHYSSPVIRRTMYASALGTNAIATEDMHSSYTHNIFNRTTSLFLIKEKPAQRDSSVMVLYLTETVAVPSADAEASAHRPPDVYVAVVDDTLHDDQPTTMYVTAYYGDGSDKDTLVVIVAPQYHEGTWKRPFSPIRRYVSPHRASSSISPGQALERVFHNDSGGTETSRIQSRTEAPADGSRRLRRRKVFNPYLQFQPSHGHDTRTFVHLATGRLDIHDVLIFLDDAEPQGVISVGSVLEIPHAFRKWRYPNYAPVWDPDFLVTGDYWSSPLAPWYNATEVDALGWSYGIAEGIYQQRYQ